MEWVVTKIGAPMFDMLHASGLGIVLAGAGGMPIKFEDRGVVYSLSSSIEGLAEVDGSDLLENILALPASEQLQEQKSWPEDSPTVANLDGLLAALFTTPPGVRVVSVADLCEQLNHQPTRVIDGLAKVKRAILRWQKYVERTSKGSATWLATALHDYDSACPAFLSAAPKGKRNMSVLMTIDPSFGYSTFRPLSDGLITAKVNLTVQGAKFAPLFARVGAARFLRAQRVGNKLVNLYVPMLNAVTLHANTALPLLDSTTATASQALVYQWLGHSQAGALPDADWQGLAYQTLQTQAVSQSISLGRGYLDYQWLSSLKARLGSKMTHYWKRLLSRPPEQHSFELDSLMDILLHRCAAAWLTHLRELSICSLENNQSEARPYTFEELKEVTHMLVPSKNTPSFSTIIERDEGTVRFGRALRLLGQVNNGALSEIIERLDTAHTFDQLIRIAATIAQECEAAGARSKFIIIPTETDLKILLDDIEQHSPRRIADLLISLSFIRYPGSDEKDGKSALSATTQAIEGEKNEY